MKQKRRIELVYKKNKEKNIDGETCYSGYISLNGELLQFSNLPYGAMIDDFEVNTKWYINEVLRKKESKHD